MSDPTEDERGEMIELLIQGSADLTMPDRLAAGLSTAAQAGETATAGDVGRLLPTHLWPGTDPDQTEMAASGWFDGDVQVARCGLEITSSQ